MLMRSGHTEACIDLCRLAGLPPVGVLAELMNDDGTVMRGPAVTEFAARHKLKQISIADLIAYRQTRDKLVKRIGEFPVQSEIGTLAGLCLCDAVRRHPAHGLRLRPHRRRQGHARAAAPRRHHPRRVRRGASGPVRVAALQAGRPRRDRVPARRRGGGADACHPAGGLDRLRSRALAAMARGWAWRPDSQGSRHHLHPVADLAQADLCRPCRLRHRDRVDRESTNRRPRQE